MEDLRLEWRKRTETTHKNDHRVGDDTEREINVILENAGCLHRMSQVEEETDGNYVSD